MDEGGVGSEGVMNLSGFTARQVRVSVSWLRLAKTFATRKRAVELLPSSPILAFWTSLVILIVGRVSAVNKAVWLDCGEKGGVGPLWRIASVAIGCELLRSLLNSNWNFEWEFQ